MEVGVKTPLFLTGFTFSFFHFPKRKDSINTEMERSSQKRLLP